MKRMVVLVFCASLAVSGHLRSEVLHLKDGSVLKGRLVKMELDTLYFETSFGPRMAVPRGRVARIDFDENWASPSGRPGSGAAVFTASEPGTLAVSFEEFELTSRIVLERGGSRAACERENTLEMTLVVNGLKVYSTVDSLTDKTVRKGPETVLRNDMRPRGFEVPLAPGIHRCVVAFGNTRASEHVELLDPGPLDKKLVLDPVRVDPGRTTHVRIGMKRKWTGKTELVRIE